MTLATPAEPLPRGYSRSIRDPLEVAAVGLLISMHELRSFREGRWTIRELRGNLYWNFNAHCYDGRFITIVDEFVETLEEAVDLVNTMENEARRLRRRWAAELR